jgi:hypothetical protein
MRSRAANFVQLNTSAQTDGVGLVFTFADTSDAPAVPFYAVLNLRDDTLREVVKFSTKTSTTLEVDSLSDRYLDGSVATSGLTHPTNSTVLLAPVAQHLDDIWVYLEGQTLDDLDDVDVSSATDGQFLKFDAGSGEWVPDTVTFPSPIGLIVALGG